MLAKYKLCNLRCLTDFKTGCNWRLSCFQELSDTEGFNEECEHQNPTRQNNGEVSNDENDVDDETMSGKYAQKCNIIFNHVF